MEDLILIVDDARFARRIETKALQDAGFEHIVEAKTAKEALQIKADMHIVEQIDKKQTEKIGIYLNFANTLNGAVLLLMDMQFIHQIVEVLLEQPVAEQKLLTDEESASAIAEFANIIVASYMNAMGSYTGIRIFVTPVSVKLGYADELVKDALQNLNLCCNEAICVNTGLSTIDANGEGLSDVGHFIMMPDDTSVQKIMEAISI